jgi:hypothetical protein
MKRKFLNCLAAIALGIASCMATPALAFHGGFGGMGGMHGGFGGMHGGMGGMHGGFGGMHGGIGGMHSGFGAMNVGGRGVGFHGGMPAVRAGFAPMGHRFVSGPFRFHHFRHFHNVVVAPVGFYGGFYGGDYGYDNGCWSRVWTNYYGWRWIYIC